MAYRLAVRARRRLSSAAARAHIRVGSPTPGAVQPQPGGALIAVLGFGSLSLISWSVSTTCALAPCVGAGSLGTLAATGAAAGSAFAVAVQGAGSVSSLTVRGGAGVPLDAVEGDGSFSGVTLSAPQTVALAFAGGAGSLSGLTVRGGASAGLSFVSGIGSVNPLAVPVQGAAAGLTAVSATTSLGSLAVTGGAGASATAVAGVGSVATLTARGGAGTQLAARIGTGTLGPVAVSTEEDIFAAMLPAPVPGMILAWNPAGTAFVNISFAAFLDSVARTAVLSDPAVSRYWIDRRNV